jgi:hypothetical protein
VLDKFDFGYKLFKRLAPRNTNSPKKYRDPVAKIYIGVSLEHVKRSVTHGAANADAHIPSASAMIKIRFISMSSIDKVLYFGAGWSEQPQGLGAECRSVSLRWLSSAETKRLV